MEDAVIFEKVNIVLPFSCIPWNGVFLLLLNVLFRSNVHSTFGSITVTCATG